jgi:hypothetical protein
MAVQTLRTTVRKSAKRPPLKQSSGDGTVAFEERMA